MGWEVVRVRQNPRTVINIAALSYLLREVNFVGEREHTDFIKAKAWMIV